MMKKILIIFLFATFIHQKAQNQNCEIIKHDFTHFVDIRKTFFRQPLNWESKDWQILAGITAGTAISVLADNSLKTIVQENQSKIASDIFKIDDFYGSYYSFLIPFSAYSIGYFSENEDLRKLGLLTAEAIAYSGLITLSLKFIIGRNRPFTENGVLKFNPFSTNNEFNSFSSGHTTIAFAISTVMANYSDNFYWKAAWFSLAGTTGLARIYHNQHWFSDVIFSGIVGYSVADFIINNDKETQNGKNLSIIPTTDRVFISIKL